MKSFQRDFDRNISKTFEGLSMDEKQSENVKEKPKKKKAVNEIPACSSYERNRSTSLEEKQPVNFNPTERSRNSFGKFKLL